MSMSVDGGDRDDDDDGLRITAPDLAIILLAEAGGLLRTSTPPTLNRLLLPRESV